MELIRLRAGLYVDPGTSDIARHALQHNGRLACVSAATSYGLWVLERGPLHIHIDRAHHASEHDRCRPTLHWDGADSHEGGDRLRVPLTQALAQVACCQGEEGLLVTLESALRQRLLCPRELALLRARLPRRFAAIVDFAHDRADSGLESLVRWRLAKLGILASGQHAIPGVGRVDLLIGDRLVLELDGSLYHSGEVSIARDRDRDALATALGFRVLRFGTHRWCTTGRRSRQQSLRWCWRVSTARVPACGCSGRIAAEWRRRAACRPGQPRIGTPQAEAASQIRSVKSRRG